MYLQIVKEADQKEESGSQEEGMLHMQRSEFCLGQEFQPVIAVSADDRLLHSCCNICNGCNAGFKMSPARIGFLQEGK